MLIIIQKRPAGGADSKVLQMQIEFFFDYRSPFAYLASTQLAGLGADVSFRPIDIFAVMKQVNNQPSPLCPPKARYAVVDATRWAERYGQPFAPNTALLSALGSGAVGGDLFVRAGLAAQDLGVFETLSPALFRAIWADTADLASEPGRAAFLQAGGLPANLFERAAEDEVSRRLEGSDREAVERGIFGVPTFFVDGEIFFGNDRLEFVWSKIAAAGAEGGDA
jgi:2-hydroxychromene-2-carboxylate isomerase